MTLGMDGSKGGLIVSSIIEPKDELEEKLERSYTVVIKLTSGLSERETNDVLNAHVCKGGPQHEEIQQGLLYSILVDSSTAPQCYRDMNLVCRDGFNTALTRINQIIFEKWLKLRDTSRTQVLWLCRELVKNSVIGADSVVTSLMRQVAGGDITPKNIWLTESLLDILSENRSWLDKYPQLLSMCVYTYLRVMVDHNGQMYHTLRTREAEFIASILRERWTECGDRP